MADLTPTQPIPGMEEEEEFDMAEAPIEEEAFGAEMGGDLTTALDELSDHPELAQYPKTAKIIGEASAVYDEEHEAMAGDDEILPDGLEVAPEGDEEDILDMDMEEELPPGVDDADEKEKAPFG